MKTVKCLPEFEYFTVFLKKGNIISKIRRSKVTDYATLMYNDVNINASARSKRKYRLDWSD